MTPPKRFDIFPPDWRMLRMSRCVQIFLLISSRSSSELYGKVTLPGLRVYSSQYGGDRGQNLILSALWFHDNLIILAVVTKREFWRPSDCSVIISVIISGILRAVISHTYDPRSDVNERSPVSRVLDLHRSKFHCIPVGTGPILPLRSPLTAI